MSGTMIKLDVGLVSQGPKLTRRQINRAFHTQNNVQLAQLFHLKKEMRGEVSSIPAAGVIFHKERDFECIAGHYPLITETLN